MPPHDGREVEAVKRKVERRRIGRWDGRAGGSFEQLFGLARDS
jgi:hypothetical protein